MVPVPAVTAGAVVDAPVHPATKLTLPLNELVIWPLSVTLLLASRLRLFPVLRTPLLLTVILPEPPEPFVVITTSLDTRLPLIVAHVTVAGVDAPLNIF